MVGAGPLYSFLCFHLRNPSKTKARVRARSVWSFFVADRHDTVAGPWYPTGRVLQEHFEEAATEFDVQVARGFITMRPNNYSLAATERIPPFPHHGG